MTYLTEEEIIAVNKAVLEKTGQKFSGIQYRQGLSLVTEQPQMIVFGRELYPTIWLKAAYIMQKIIKKHIFVDGNKRTAYISTLLFLRYNHYRLYLSVDTAEALVMQVTVADDTEEEMIKIANFLEKNCISDYK